MRPRRFTDIPTVEERLFDDAKQLREQAAKLPAGREREIMLRKAKMDETAAQIFEWLNTPGLKPPT
jgi:hypothetical protein